MQIVIDIDDGIAQGIIEGINDMPSNIVRSFQATIADAIKKGTPLPKGHGDLIDRKELLKQPIDKANYPSSYVKCSPAIIKADKAETTPTKPTCKDCKFKSRDKDFRNLKCPWGERIEMTDNDFCSRYERR